jgi:hypothetical protein
MMNPKHLKAPKIAWSAQKMETGITAPDMATGTGGLMHQDAYKAEVDKMCKAVLIGKSGDDCYTVSAKKNELGKWEYGVDHKKAEVLSKPPVSEAQRAAMHAAAAGKSTIGIPKSVGKEFSDADKGGKLPAHKAEVAKSIGTFKSLDEAKEMAQCHKAELYIDDQNAGDQKKRLVTIEGKDKTEGGTPPSDPKDIPQVDPHGEGGDADIKAKKEDGGKTHHNEKKGGSTVPKEPKNYVSKPGAETATSQKAATPSVKKEEMEKGGGPLDPGGTVTPMMMAEVPMAKPPSGKAPAATPKVPTSAPKAPTVGAPMKPPAMKAEHTKDGVRLEDPAHNKMPEAPPKAKSPIMSRKKLKEVTAFRDNIHIPLDERAEAATAVRAHHNVPRKTRHHYEGKSPVLGKMEYCPKCEKSEKMCKCMGKAELGKASVDPRNKGVQSKNADLATHHAIRDVKASKVALGKGAMVAPPLKTALEHDRATPPVMGAAAPAPKMPSPAEHASRASGLADFMPPSSFSSRSPVLSRSPGAGAKPGPKGVFGKSNSKE